MISVAPAAPPVSVHQCHINATYQCPSELPFSVNHQCQSVPPISASQCHLSVPYISAMSVPPYQCPSAPPICPSVQPISAHHCSLISAHQ
ncbi:unnamed protein product [Staurois parvus]|uniref:Uncharacterized protein n=1 Tax=Staurois parvus TaxID=386267 RepID=A0ABN9FPD1_9NEOB|nr:unnamed protein product [Staurois parvus]